VLNTIGISGPHQAAQLTMGMTPKKRKRSSSSKENTPARWSDQFQGVQPRQKVVHRQQAMSDVQDMMKLMKEDISRRRSFERRTEKRLQEVFEETRVLRREVQSFIKQL
jgi:hypothetical protein